MIRFIYFLFCLFAICITQASQVTTEKVLIQNEIRCFIDGKDLGKQHFNSQVEVKIYDNGTEFWGTGEQKNEYPYPVKTHIMVYDLKDDSIKYKYAMDFSIMAKAYTGAFWGEGSSIVFFDSFRNFSPIKHHGSIEVSQDKKDYCNFETVMLPVN